MPYKIIQEECWRCGECEWGCPTGAVYRDVWSKKYVIDPDKCTECVGNFDEPECVTECLAECITPDPDRKETREQLEAKWHKLGRPKPEWTRYPWE